MPIHRLNEKLTDYATLVDVTCDSDGKIDRFVDLKDVKHTLELHDWKPDQTYYLGIFLVGAYQEVMGSHHNLFGHPNEAHIAIDNDGRFHVTRIVPGSCINDMMQFAQYDAAQLAESYRRQLLTQVQAGKLSEQSAEDLLSQYRAVASKSTYLD